MPDAIFPAWLQDACEAVRQRSWRRVILLGEDLREGPYSLKAGLAQSGVMVFVPGAGDRAWLQELSYDAERRPDDASLERLATLLADGMEHGVHALIVTNVRLGLLAREALPQVPMLEIEGEQQ